MVAGKFQVVTPLDLLINELRHTGSVHGSSAVFAVHTRLELDTYAMIEALTAQAGVSRNKIMNQVVAVGLATTLQALPDDMVAELKASASKILFSVVKDDSKSIEVLSQ